MSSCNNLPNYYIEVPSHCEFEGDTDCGNCYGCITGVQRYPLNVYNTIHYDCNQSNDCNHCNHCNDCNECNHCNQVRECLFDGDCGNCCGCLGKY